MALVDKKYTLEYPPVAKTTASAAWVLISPVFVIANNNSLGFTVNQNQIKHFGSRVHLNLACINHSRMGLIGTEKELLTRLAFGIKGSGYQSTTKRPVVQQATIFSRKWNTLRNGLIDDVDTDLCQTVHIGFTGTKVSPLTVS